MLPNEAQLLEENDSFALELQGIIAQTLPPLSASLYVFLSPLALSFTLRLILAPTYSQRSSLVPLFVSLPALCPALSVSLLDVEKG